MNCFGKGECVNGKCKCFPGFSGLDCSSSKIKEKKFFF